MAEGSSLTCFAEFCYRRTVTCLASYVATTVCISSIFHTLRSFVSFATKHKTGTPSPLCKNPAVSSRDTTENTATAIFSKFHCDSGKNTSSYLVYWLVKSPNCVIEVFAGWWPRFFWYPQMSLKENFFLRTIKPFLPPLFDDMCT